MIMFGYKIEKVKKERKVVFYKTSNGGSKFELEGDGWKLDALEYGLDLQSYLQKINLIIPDSTLEQRVELIKIFLNDDVKFIIE
tara:strand:+ start:594 stop:845 length:252 start_codon:yes stop_codon:yes gene_type:complete